VKTNSALTYNYIIKMIKTLEAAVTQFNTARHELRLLGVMHGLQILGMRFGGNAVYKEGWEIGMSYVQAARLEMPSAHGPQLENVANIRFLTQCGEPVNFPADPPAMILAAYKTACAELYEVGFTDALNDALLLCDNEHYVRGYQAAVTSMTKMSLSASHDINWVRDKVSDSFQVISHHKIRD
jgi:hypothetical protein